MASTSAILTVVQLHVDRAAVDVVLDLLRELAEASRRERGCTRFEVLQAAAEPTRFVTVERWDSDLAADLHRRSAHVQAALARLGPLLAAPPRVVRYRSVER